MKLEELANAKHPYYCSGSNYYSNDASMRFSTMTEFLDAFDSADVDMNLCFRWDVRECMNDDDTAGTGSYSAEVFIMKQRKVIFSPCTIDSIDEHEVARFEQYLRKHSLKLIEMWSPII
ncbi:MAG: hypothetical protein ACRCXB_02815 [Aeromonadaceae bacterium]